jgi:hypothetical protein
VVGIISVMLVVVLITVLVVVAGGHKSNKASSSATSPSTVAPGTSPATTIPRIPRGPVTASTSLTWDRGSVVFNDDFQDPGSGWPTQPLPSGTSFNYGPGGYVVVADGTLHHIAYAPYTEPVAQLSMTAIATQTANAPQGAGFGVLCGRGTGATAVEYEFLVLGGSRWFVERHDGSLAAGTGHLIKEGTSPLSPGSAPVTVTAMCATGTDGQTSRLALFVNGFQVADVSDTASVFTDAGWFGGVDVASQATRSSTVTLSHYEERDLAF